MLKLGLAPGNGLRTYEQYYDAVEGLPSPLKASAELTQQAAASSSSRRSSSRFVEGTVVRPWLVQTGYIHNRNSSTVTSCAAAGQAC
jgi:hypothetical protein